EAYSCQAVTTTVLSETLAPSENVSVTGTASPAWNLPCAPMPCLSARLTARPGPTLIGRIESNVTPGALTLVSETAPEACGRLVMVATNAPAPGAEATMRAARTFTL